MSRDNIEMLILQQKAMIERLDDPRNISKGDWRDMTTSEMITKLGEEINELKAELPANGSLIGLSIDDLNALRHELSDVSVVCGFLIQKIESEKDARQV